MDFRFDARAALQEIRRLTHGPSNVPKVPKADDPLCQTLGGLGVVERADPQSCVFSDLDSFAERAAIIEHDQCLTRAKVVVMAAPLQCFPAATQLYQSAVRHWLERLDALAPAEPAGRRHIESARTFTADGWAAQALALGWDELSLYGLDAAAPWARLDRMGAAHFGAVRAVTAEAIVYTTGNRVRRGHQAAGARLPWGEGR